eukprot:TRINITY_DN43059_c0_g1_i1.p1 TRINITY_DN43059_c0_g1~~TRINITY_DN43059_c0_g1_i1.p1  ORF type:complete len:170 (-),score=29.30 TRINITY_DN43059_c0_g1_i1:53-562(-)
MVFGLRLTDLSHSTSFFGGLFGGGSGSDSAVEFRDYYAAACPHCTSLSPAWKEAAATYSGPVRFRQIECADKNWQPVAENADLCGDINGYPTLKMFKGGKEVATYQGDRSAASLVDFAKQYENTAMAAMPLPLAFFAPTDTKLGPLCSEQRLQKSTEISRRRQVGNSFL